MDKKGNSIPVIVTFNFSIGPSKIRCPLYSKEKHFLIIIYME